MSLIVTSSSQQQYGGIVNENPTRTIAGIENPAKYQNHFTSPLKIEANSEIALESIKIKRAPVFDIEDDTIFYRYWGQEQTKLGAPGKNERVSMPIPVRPRPGSYSVEDMGIELDERLNKSYCSPDIYGNSAVTSVTNASGAFGGYKLLQTARGSASLAAKDASGSAVLQTSGPDGYWLSPKQITNTSASATFALSTGTTVVTCVKAGGSLDELDDSIYTSSWIGRGLPIGLAEGHYKVKVNGAPGGWRVGLSRPQTEYRSRETTPAGMPPHQMLPGGDLADSRGKWRYRPTNTTTGRDQSDFYDYMVQDDGSAINVYQCCTDPNTGLFTQTEVKYYGYGGATFSTKLTSASFNASFDQVQFTTEGDEMTLQFFDKGKVTYVQVVNQNIGSLIKYHVFVPMGETRNALFPRLNIAADTEILTITRYDTHYTARSGAGEFRFPDYNDTTRLLTTGDDFYSNNRVARSNDRRIFLKDTEDRPYCLSQTVVCDQKPQYDVDPEFSRTAVQSFVGMNGGNTAPNYDHVLIVGQTKSQSIDDYLEGKYATSTTSGLANSGRLLGYGGTSVLKETSTAGYVGGAGGLAVSFSSAEQPAYRVQSCFVRISNLNHNSYNGAKQSISKILYHLPRFSNEGREFGDLYFSPGQKTYLKLNNPSGMMLNNLQIEIVDVNEVPVQDLNGNTIIVFHIKPV